VESCIVLPKRVDSLRTRGWHGLHSWIKSWTCKGSFRTTWGLKPKVVHWLYIMVVRPLITYANIVRWPRVKYRTSKAKLSTLQWLACLAIISTVKTAPTDAIEVLLELQLLHLKMETEIQAEIYTLSCNEQWKTRFILYGHTSKVQDVMKELILYVVTNKILPWYEFHKPLTEVYGKDVLISVKKWNSSGTQMGPKKMKSLKLGYMAMSWAKDLALA
jgi:hypothetical protein